MQSLIAIMSIPELPNARTADSRPDPTPDTVTDASVMPTALARSSTLIMAIWAAYGVDLRAPLKPDEPALAHAITPPVESDTLIMVLLKVD